MDHKQWVVWVQSIIYPINETIERPLEGLDFIREKVRVRDQHQCQKCGKKWVKGKRRFDIHHLEDRMESVRDYQYDKNNMDKMITYCHKCHLNLHGVKRKMVDSARVGVSKNVVRLRAEIIKNLIDKGIPQTLIAEILNITPQSVNKYAIKNSIPKIP